jgi:hypothetical protein
MQMVRHMANASKCKVLHAGSNNQRYSYHLTMNGIKTDLVTTEVERDLGVYIDTLLSFDTHDCKRNHRKMQQIIKVNQEDGNI